MVFVLGYSSAAEGVSGIYLVVGGRLRCERGVSISRSNKCHSERTTIVCKDRKGKDGGTEHVQRTRADAQPEGVAGERCECLMN